MNVFQTETAKKKGIYHLAGESNTRLTPSLCSNASRYHDDPHPLFPYSETLNDKLCPSCVMQAYKDKRLHISLKR